MNLRPSTKKINRDLLLFSGLAVFLSVITGVFLYKFLPVVVQQQIYECQTFVSSFTVKIFTCHLKTTLLVIGTIILTLISGRIALVLFRIGRLRHKIVKNAFRLKRYRHIGPLVKGFGLRKAFRLVEDDQPYAFCFGVIRQHMYVSTALIDSMNRAEVKAVLLHEKYHLEQKDSLTMLIASIMQILFPFFPIIGDLFIRYRIECETRADQAAIETLQTREPLVTVLKKMLSAPPPKSFAFAPLADRTLEPRIRQLVTRETPRTRPSLWRLGVSLVSMLFLFSMILAPTDDSTLMVTTSSSNTTSHLCLPGSTCALSCTSDSSLKFSLEESLKRKDSPSA